jgi:hypothetical protein
MQRDIIALAREPERNLAPDPLGSAGHQGSPCSSSIHHAVLPSLRSIFMFRLRCSQLPAQR